MNHVILTISGINCDNDYMVQDFLSSAGFAGSAKRVNDETLTLDIGSDECRKEAGIKDAEVAAMIGSIVLFTSCKVRSTLALPPNRIKAYMLNAGDRFIYNNAICVLKYDAYYPDPHGNEVALIFNQIGSGITENIRMHGQQAMEISQ